MTTRNQKNKHSRIEERKKVISSVKGPVAFMRPEDIGSVVVRSSMISPLGSVTVRLSKSIF